MTPLLGLTMLLHPEPITVFADARGALLKVWPGRVDGEVYVVELRPGHPRGHHYHERGGEWFIPLSGSVCVTAMLPGGEPERVTLSVGQRVRVDAGVAHVLSAAGGPALVAAIADNIHQDEVTIPYTVPQR
jgi:mannose-6-phosphate isomerase-like protein (cupin superfamily)